MITRTRVGMLLRAGAANREMVSALGTDINRLFMLVFAAGAMLAGFAGLVSVGQQAFVGIGAYAMFAAVILLGLSPLAGLLIGGLVAMALSVPVDLCCLISSPSQRMLSSAERSRDGGRVLACQVASRYGSSART